MPSRREAEPERSAGVIGLRRTVSSPSAQVEVAIRPPFVTFLWWRLPCEHPG